MGIFLPYMNLFSKTSEKFYQQFSKTKLKFQEKVASYWCDYKRLVVLTVQELFEIDFW